MIVMIVICCVFNEMRQSVVLILQCIEKIEKGPIRVSSFKEFNSLTRLALKQQMQSLIWHFKFYTEGYEPYCFSVLCFSGSTKR